MNQKIWSFDKGKSLIEIDFTSNNIINIVLVYLLLNTKQEIILCKIKYYIIYNETTPKFEQFNQLLLIIKDKGGST